MFIQLTDRLWRQNFKKLCRRRIQKELVLINVLNFFTFIVYRVVKKASSG